MTQAIILGDVHLGKSTNIGKNGVGASLNSRIVDQINLLDWTLDQAVEKSIEHIIITGDIFEDPKPRPELITMFIAWLKKCQAYDIHVHIIMGNHDILRSGFVYTSPLDIISEVELENINVYKQVDTIIIDRTAFTFVPFRDRKSFGVSSNAEALSILRDGLTYELAGIPVTYKKILVGHLALEGSIPIGDEFDDMTNELFCPLDMFKGYNYVWMGHVHKPQVMQKENPHIAHVGSMDISNFGETDHKKHIVIVNCSSDGFVIEHLPTRPLKKISITVPKDTADPTAYVLKQIRKTKNELDKAIVRVEIAMETADLKSIDKEAIGKFLTKQGVFNVANITENKKVAVVKKDSNNTITTKMDVTAAIKKYADTYVDAPVRAEFSELAMSIYKQYKEEAKE